VSTPRIEALGQVAVVVRDLDRAVAFHEQVEGNHLALMSEAPEESR
jgi:predicted enzyme related to lactoylglutathione lyase